MKGRQIFSHLVINISVIHRQRMLWREKEDV